jgi:hypothetical protein
MTPTEAIQCLSPKNQSVLEYWYEKAGERAMPSRVDLDPVIDLPKLTLHMFLVDVERGATRFRFRLVGTGVVDHVGRDMTGKYLDELFDHENHYIEVKEDYLDVVRHRAPRMGVVRFFSDLRGMVSNYERLLLPLSDDGERVNLLFGSCSPLSAQLLSEKMLFDTGRGKRQVA